MNPLNNTFNKAWVGGLLAPIVDWLVGVGAQALSIHAAVDMPQAVQGALTALVVGGIIYWVPNRQS